jgi:hypothetical protein
MKLKQRLLYLAEGHTARSCQAGFMPKKSGLRAHVLAQGLVLHLYRAGQIRDPRWNYRTYPRSPPFLMLRNENIPCSLGRLRFQ